VAERRAGRAAVWKALRLRPAGGDRLVVGVELAAGTASLRPTWKERRDVIGQLTKQRGAVCVASESRGQAKGAHSSASLSESGCTSVSGGRPFRRPISFSLSSPTPGKPRVLPFSLDRR
jgi:hypothetical protein